jgi:predicted GTPase
MDKFDQNLIQNDLNGCNQIIAVSENVISSIFENNEQQNKLKEELKALKLDLEDQRKKLIKDDYEIAVVGREKAGKSSLLNAWLKFDLLPTANKCCTYTSIEIRSCSRINEQKYRIEYFDNQKFEDRFKKIKETIENSQAKQLSRDISLYKLEEELNEIVNLKDQIELHLGKG